MKATKYGWLITRDVQFESGDGRFYQKFDIDNIYKEIIINTDFKDLKKR